MRPCEREAQSWLSALIMRATRTKPLLPSFFFEPAIFVIMRCLFSEIQESSEGAHPHDDHSSGDDFHPMHYTATRVLLM